MGVKSNEWTFPRAKQWVQSLSRPEAPLVSLTPGWITRTRTGYCSGAAERPSLGNCICDGNNKHGAEMFAMRSQQLRALWGKQRRLSASHLSVFQAAAAEFALLKCVWIVADTSLSIISQGSGRQADEMDEKCLHNVSFSTVSQK